MTKLDLETKRLHDTLKTQILQEKLRKATYEATSGAMSIRPSRCLGTILEHDGTDWVCSHPCGLKGYGKTPEAATLNFDHLWYGLEENGLGG